MAELLSVLVGAAGFAAVMRLYIHLFRDTPDGLAPGTNGGGRQPIDTGPVQPCWIEEVGRDGRIVYARAQCPNHLLLELDARARRHDFPIPILYD